MIRNTLLVCAIALSIWCNAETSKSVPDSWNAVEYKSLSGHLLTLNASDRIEQVRDWAFLSAVQALREESAGLSDILYDFSPVRFDYFSNFQSHEAGPSRSRMLKGDRLLVVLPENDPERLQLLGRCLDRNRLALGHAPGTVIVYEYRDDRENNRVLIHRNVDIRGSTFYASDAGYFEATIRSVADLQAFLSMNLDLVLVQKQADGLLVGGRRLNGQMKSLISLADIGTLVRASSNLDDAVKRELLNGGILQRDYLARIDEAVQEQLGKSKWSDFAGGGDLAERYRQDVMKAVPFSTFENLQVDAIMKSNPPSLGFSLDPKMNYAGLSDDMQSAMSRENLRFNEWLAADVRREVDESSTFTQKSTEKLIDAISKSRRKGSAEPVLSTQPAPESSIETLLGKVRLDPVPAESPGDPLKNALLSYRNSDTFETERENEVAQVAQQIEKAVANKKDVLRTISAALKQQDVMPLLRFEAYLDPESLGVAFGPGSPTYMVRDLQRMLIEQGADLPVNGTYGPKTRDNLKEFQHTAGLPETGLVDRTTWNALLASSDEVSAELIALEQLIQMLRQRDSYQCARYDGDIQGSAVSMTLFYTDLLMKLWSFKYQGSAPTVDGFVPITELDISPIYWDRQKRYSSTRGWLGPRSDGYEFDKTGTSLRFAPIATRLFTASSNPLLPGKETNSPFSADHFSSWWNENYEAIADYEPQYHRLNEIIKWSIVVQWLAQQLPAPMRELQSAPMNTSNRFKVWLQSEPGLTTRPTLPYVNSGALKQSTECMRLVQSAPFSSMDGIYVMQGGVSLGKRAEIEARLANSEKIEALGVVERRPGVDYISSGKLEGFTRIKSADGSTFDLHPEDHTVRISPGSKTRFEGSNQELQTQQPIDVAIDSSPDTLSYRMSSGKRALFEWSARSTGNTIEIGFQEGPLMRVAHLIETEVTPEELHDNTQVPLDIALGDDRTLVNLTERNDWVSISRDKNGGPTKEDQQLVVGSQSKVYRLGSIAASEVEPLTEKYSWAGIEPDLFFPDQQRAHLVLLDAAPKDDVTDVTLDGPYPPIRAKADTEGRLVWQRQRTSLKDELKADEVLRGAWDLTGLSQISDAAGLYPDGFTYLQKATSGELLMAYTGTRPSAELQSEIGSLITSRTDGIKGVLLVKGQSGIKLMPSGVLRAAEQPSEADLSIASQASQLLEQQPTLLETLSELPNLSQDELNFLKTASPDRRASYLEFKGGVDVPEGYAFVDFQIDRSSPSLMVKRGNTVSFADLGLPEYTTIRNYVEAVYSGKQEATVSEFLDRTKPLMNSLQRLANAVGEKSILTVENAPPPVAQIWAMHGGDDSVRFIQDSPNVRRSVEHVKTPIVPSVRKAVFACTSSLEGFDSVGFENIRESLNAVRARTVSIFGGLTSVQFRDLLIDPDVLQITLLVRSDRNGLVFRDKWESYSDLRFDLRHATHKSLIHLLSNGGGELVGVFADSGAFDRVVLSKFDLDDLPSLESAFLTVKALFSVASTTTVTLMKGEFETLVEQHPELRDRFTSSATYSGDTYIIDMQKVFAGRTFSDDAKSPLLSSDISEMLQERIEIPNEPARDVDNTVRTEVRGRVRDAMKSPDTRSAGKLLRSMPSLKVELRPPLLPETLENTPHVS